MTLIKAQIRHDSHLDDVLSTQQKPEKEVCLLFHEKVARFQQREKSTRKAANVKRVFSQLAKINAILK